MGVDPRRGGVFPPWLRGPGLAGRLQLLPWRGNVKKLCHAVLGLLVLTGGAGPLGAQTAPPGPPGHVYFQAAIHDRDGVVTGAHALVRVGGTADLALGPKSHGRALRLRYQLEEVPAVPAPTPAAEGNEGAKVGFKATVTGMVDNREVVVGTLEWTDSEVSALTMHGGDLTWTFEAQSAAHVAAP